MTANAPGSDTRESDLEAALGRALGQRERVFRHSSLKLQPTVLQPPPGETRRPVEAPDLAGASPEDDIDLGLDDDGAAGRRQLLLAAAGVAIALIGVGGWLLFGRTAGDPLDHEPPPAIQALPAPAPAPAPATPTIPPVAPPPIEAPPPEVAPASPPAAPPMQQASSDPAMGELSTELVPPSTEGLSPARKVNAVRILMDGDRELRP